MIDSTMSCRRATALLLGLSLALITTLSVGCAKPKRGPAVPAGSTAAATVPGVPGARYFLREDLERMIADSTAAQERGAADRAARGMTGEAPRHFLAISGGGDKGAFAAGLLYGWTEAGTRPEFGVVTGVSTGSLIAPFAFVGDEYDDVLKAVYTGIGPEQIYEKRSMWSLLRGDAMADSAPLAALIAEHVDDTLLEKVAAQYERGRWLMVVTADLDARRPVIWNMGEIARVGSPEALALFRKVLLASASLPGLFPPVLFDVEVDGQPYQELHVDGGVAAQSFLFPPSFAEAMEERHLVQDRERHVYLIRNAQFKHKGSEVARSTLPIFFISNSMLFTAGGIGDIYRIYTVAERFGMDFNLAYIPNDFDAEHPEDFDTAYMNELFEFARSRAAEGYPWQHEPIGFETTLADPEKE